MMNRKSTPQLNHTELELISAFLDGQLPDEQVRQLRQRIAQDPEFKQAYEDLRLTRLALRRTPQIRRRRSFTLTPEMVEKPARVWNLKFTSRLVAVVATVLLVVVFVGDVFLLPRAGSGVAMFSAADSYSANEAADMDMLAEEPMGGGAEMPMAVEQAVEEGETDVAAAPPMEATEEQAAAAGDDTAAELDQDDSMDEATVEDDAESVVEEGFLAETATPTPTPKPHGTLPPQAGRIEPTDETGMLEGDGAVGDDSAENLDMGETIPKDIPPQLVEEREPGFFDRVDVVTVVELALLALALGSGVVALVVGRRGR